MLWLARKNSKITLPGKIHFFFFFLESTNDKFNLKMFLLVIFFSLKHFYENIFSFETYKKYK